MNDIKVFAYKQIEVWYFALKNGVFTADEIEMDMHRWLRLVQWMEGDMASAIEKDFAATLRQMYTWMLYLEGGPHSPTEVADEMKEWLEDHKHYLEF